MTNNGNINDILNKLCKEYNFEYGVYLEKKKVHEELSNDLTLNSIKISIKNINNIKEEMLGVLLGEITNPDNGNENDDLNSKKNIKSLFKMEF